MGEYMTARTHGAAGASEETAYALRFPVDDAPELAAHTDSDPDVASPRTLVDGLTSRRGHAFGIAVLVLATAAFSVPLWDVIRAQVEERVGGAPDGAIGVGAAIAWCTGLLANVLTLGLLGVLVGALGAVAARHLPLPGSAVRPTARPDDFTRVRRAFTLGWAAFVLAKLIAWTVAGLALGRDVARAVPAVTHLDGWLLLLPAVLLCAGRAVGYAWPRAAAVAVAVTAAYATALWLTPS
ncbi:hypothetical protein [Streptomyces lanatus]|uniref:YIP1 family protein n=1 Tax=Streptomyces lanatus TaxID=66900 RepID=A0ABV1XI98_9ACTN|nr:hypothetical protein [Streptomyces lanatus]GHG93293.1 hypothetical protein GCM10018780_15610 [Streptomyces lanatus]